MQLFSHDHVQVHRHGNARRRFLKTLSASALAAGTFNFRDLMCLQAAELRKQGKSMILLWMQGGPSQMETFDPKPGTENGGQTKAISTATPGIQVAEGWENTAKVMNDIALIRSMTNREGNHQRAAYQLHTGYIPSGSVKHPALAANLAKELADPEQTLPAVVSVGPTYGAGFLGVDYEPFVVQRPGETPNNVASAVNENRYKKRLGLLDELEGDFAKRGGRNVVDSHRRLYSKASRMVLSSDADAFDSSSEPAALKANYGDSAFGKGCLLARRLVEAGVTFVEVRSNGWDTHDNIFERVSNNAAQVDPGMGTLIADLKQRGMLENTLVVWMGEFGRTPRINARGGRDHYPRCFNVAMAGSGVKGGQVIGSSTDNGASVKENPVTVPDLFCSICHSLGVNPETENISPLGRPMKIVDGGTVVDQLFTGS